MNKKTLPVSQWISQWVSQSNATLKVWTWTKKLSKVCDGDVRHISSIIALLSVRCEREERRDISLIILPRALNAIRVSSVACLILVQQVVECWCRPSLSAIRLVVVICQENIIWMGWLNHIRVSHVWCWDIIDKSSQHESWYESLFLYTKLGSKCFGWHINDRTHFKCQYSTRTLIEDSWF